MPTAALIFGVSIAGTLGRVAVATVVVVGVKGRVVPDAAALFYVVRWVDPRLAVILRFDVANVEKSVSPDAKVHKRRLDARFEIDDDAFVNIADVVVLIRSFDVQLFQNSVLDDRNPALFRLRDID